MRSVLVAVIVSIISTGHDSTLCGVKKDKCRLSLIKKEKMIESLISIETMCFGLDEKWKGKK